ncbi:MAG: 50S ribosomal protein L6 [Thermoanaerobaculales bacterium]|jgi:large subunit ribosomal protein L6|nr:50S ribosomal protein L6 [Thermoanaerobaculales bacterium]
MPVPVPKGVEVSIAGGVVRVKGPKGQLEVGLLPGISAAVEAGELKIARSDEERQTRSAHGLLRSLLSNAAIGVSRGWSKELDIVGIGYRAESKGRSVRFNLGYSHPIDFDLPAGIEVDVDAKSNRVTVRGVDRQQVGQIAADIRALRPPEPYKGKGIRYATERIRTKAGKQGA